MSEAVQSEESNSDDSNTAAVEENHTAIRLSRTSSALPTSYESANITNLPTSPEVDNTTTIEATSPNPSNNGSVPSSRYQGTRASTTLSYHSNTEDIRDPRGAVTDTDNLEVLNPIASQNDNASQEAIIVDSTPTVQFHPVPNNEAPPPYPGPPTPWRLQHDPRMLRNSSTVPLLLNGTSSNYNERRQEQVQSSRAVRTVNVQNIPTIPEAEQPHSQFITQMNCSLFLLVTCLLLCNITSLLFTVPAVICSWRALHASMQNQAESANKRRNVAMVCNWVVVTEFLFLVIILIIILGLYLLYVDGIIQFNKV